MKRQSGLLDFLKLSDKKVQKLGTEKDSTSTSNNDSVEIQPKPTTSAQNHNVCKSNVIQEGETVLKPNCEKETTRYPLIWSDVQWRSFSAKNPWLIAEGGMLGCKLCREINLQGLGACKEQGLSLSIEWCECKVAPSLNEKRSTQLSNLRVKIKKHSESKSHQLADRIKKQAEKDIVTNLLKKECKQADEATGRVFRTVYYIAKSDRPFSDHEALIELQELNGINLGAILHSRYSATQIVEHIAHTMKNKMILQIIERETKLSVLVDESSTLGRKSVLIVYICVVLSTDPIFMFLDLVELSNQGAEHITEMLIKTLIKYGFTNEYLSQNWVSFVSDGASVMTGKNSGVASRIGSIYPSVLSWHCMSHRLELAVGDALKSVTSTNHFQSFLGCIYSLYSQSNKNQQELKEAAAQLEIQILKIGKVFDIRWVASSYRTVEAIWNNFAALHLHFTNAADDTSRDGRTRQKFAGLAGKLGSSGFLQNLGMMHDYLKELANLSHELQRRNITLKKADEYVKRTIRVLESYKNEPGEKFSEVLDAVRVGKFRNVNLKKSNVQEINNTQFLQSLVDNIKMRLTNEQNSILEDLQILERSSWPENVTIRYGESAIKRVCTRFCLDITKSINGMREYVDSNNSNFPEDLQDIQKLIKTFPISTAECERGFSAMNLIMTKLRSTLLIQNVSNLMIIRINGPPLNAFNPDKYVSSWLVKHRSATDNQSRKTMLKNVDDNNQIKELWNLL